jgi:hypothetical protein
MLLRMLRASQQLVHIAAIEFPSMKWRRIEHKAGNTGAPMQAVCV